QRRPHGFADGPPDILGIVLGPAGPRTVHRDRTGGPREQHARAAEQAGADTARADIDRADEVAHQCVFRVPEGPSSSGRRRMSSKTRSGPAAATRRSSRAGPAWPPPSKAKTRMPARFAASIPAGLSS